MIKFGSIVLKFQMRTGRQKWQSNRGIFTTFCYEGGKKITEFIERNLISTISNNE
jgi:hypothetical protein